MEQTSEIAEVPFKGLALKIYSVIAGLSETEPESDNKRDFQQIAISVAQRWQSARRRDQFLRVMGTAFVPLTFLATQVVPNLRPDSVTQIMVATGLACLGYVAGKFIDNTLHNNRLYDLNIRFNSERSRQKREAMRLEPR